MPGLEANAPQRRSKPRTSSLLDCARNVVYSMTNEPESNPEEDTDHRDQAYSNEDNRRNEDLNVEIIESMGLTRVVDRQVTLSDDSPTTGHPDGAFAESDGTIGQDYGTFERTIDGLVYGYENKKLGRRSYLEVFKNGLLAAKPGYIVQAIMYGLDLGWDVVQFIIIAEDASSMRQEATMARRGKNGAWADRPDWNPKAYFPVVDLRPLYPLYPFLKARAEAFSAAVATGAKGGDIVPEYDGKKFFPCEAYCSMRDKCRADTAAMTPTITIPRTPLNTG
jgi:hypothetical protein